jgi:hypothetical protein
VGPVTPVVRDQLSKKDEIRWKQPILWVDLDVLLDEVHNHPVLQILDAMIDF